MITLTFRKDPAAEIRQRTPLLIVLTLLVFAALLGRLFLIQVAEGDRFAYLSENNRIRLKKIPAPRGMVFDRSGELLLDSRPSFDLLFVPEDSPEPESTLRQLARFLGREEEAFLEFFEKNGQRPPFKEIVLGRDIDWASVVAVETHQLELPGITLRIRPSRSHPYKRATSHLLGTVGEISREQLQSQGNSDYRMGDEIGKSGLEKSWEDYLRGQSGGQQVEVDVYGRRIQVLHEVKALPGHNVFLTLDQELQEVAFQMLQGKEGAIVVQDVRNGAILAMVSSPAFDPNFFARGISPEEWRALAEDRSHPLQNRVTQGQYPPGSIFKIVVTIAALEEGLVQPEEQIFDPGYFVVGRRRFRDWKEHGHGWVDLPKAIVESCDVYFYQLGQRVGVDTIARYARRLGLGKETGIALSGEQAGLIPDSDWKMRRFNEPWYSGETPSVAIGQGYVTVTPIQVVNLMTAIANGGTLYRPWFVERVQSLDGTLIRRYEPERLRSLNLSEKTLHLIRKALTDVVNTQSGTGGAAKSSRVLIAGKTGTAQVAEMEGKYVKSEDLPYEIRDHAWFVSYAPADNPEVAVVVLIEHGGHGGSAAAPVAKRIIETYFARKDQGPRGVLAMGHGGGSAH